MQTLPGVKILNVARELIGMVALAPATGVKLGEVRDALIHPTKGKLIGIEIRTPENEVRTLAATGLTIEEGTVIVQEDESSLTSEGGVTAVDVYASRGIIGAFVITDRGGLLGRVGEVHITVETRRVYYRVVKSGWQRMLGGGFFMAGNVPHSYFHSNTRLIVPADTKERYAVKSLAETAQLGSRA
jgi:sporulation protein YlmC with PRC-barrel domain